MDTRQLQAFCEVVERKSFSQAAERLGVTQPAVSLQVRSLEKRLGTQLLDRSGRRVEPTEAGLRLYRGAQRLLQMEDDLLSELAAGGDRRPGRDVRDRRLDRAWRRRARAHPLRVRRVAREAARRAQRLRHADDRRPRRRPDAAARCRRRRAAASRRRVRAVLQRHRDPRLPAGPSLRRAHDHPRRAARRDADRHAGGRRRPPDDRRRAAARRRCASAISPSGSSSACRNP